MARLKDLTGRRFGRLTVIERAPNRDGCRHSYWKCVCDCGEIRDVISTSLLSGDTKSCGCIAREVRRNNLRKIVLKHGLLETTQGKHLNAIWSGMKQRCENPNDKSFRYYGAKGICVCKEWHDNFEAFYKWAVAHGYKEGLSIDRINSDGDYSPSNCQWLTPADNCRKATALRCTKPCVK